MIDYLCRTKVAYPSKSKKRGRGRYRLFSFGDVVFLRSMSTLLAGGVSVSRLKKALPSIRRHFRQITPTSVPIDFLVTDGREVFVRSGENRLESLSEKGQMAFSFVLQLKISQGEILKKLKPNHIR